MEQEKKKVTLKIVSRIVLIILIILVLLLGIYVLNDLSQKDSYNNSLSSNKTNEEDISQNTKDKLEYKSSIITDKIKDLIAKNSITNIDFLYTSCSTEESYYQVVYILMQDNIPTASMLIFNYSKDDYELLKVSYSYNYESSSGFIIDQKTAIAILANLPFAIDRIAFANTDILSVYTKMYENNYAFSSGYKISVSTNSIGKLYIYDFEKIY